MPLRLVFVAGEGANHPGLMSVVWDVVGNLTRAQVDPSSKSSMTTQGANETIPVEVVFLDNPVFATARGAAF